MARYSGNTSSKSVNARLAEAAGRYPATAMVAELRRRKLFRGVVAADILAAVPTGEWHHVGSFAARVNYYDLLQVFAARRVLRERIAARRAAKREARSAPTLSLPTHRGCSVQWLEWAGSLNHRYARQRQAEGVAVTIRGSWFVIHLAAGDMRKRRDCRGLVVTGADGRRVW